MIGIIVIDKLLGLILLGIRDLLITIDGAAHGSWSSFLSFHSRILPPPHHLPLTTNAPMTTYTYSSIFWVSLTQELRWDIELSKVSDGPSQYQVWSVQFLATLSLCSQIKDLPCPKGQNSYLSTKHFTLKAILKLSGPKQCPFPWD